MKRRGHCSGAAVVPFLAHPPSNLGRKWEGSSGVLPAQQSAVIYSVIHKIGAEEVHVTNSQWRQGNKGEGLSVWVCWERVAHPNSLQCYLIIKHAYYPGGVGGGNEHIHSTAHFSLSHFLCRALRGTIWVWICDTQGALLNWPSHKLSEIKVHFLVTVVESLKLHLLIHLVCVMI